MKLMCFQKKKKMTIFDFKFQCIEISQNLKFISEQKQSLISNLETQQLPKFQNPNIIYQDVYTELTRMIYFKKQIMAINLLQKEVYHILMNVERIHEAVSSRKFSTLFQFQANFEQIFWSAKMIKNYSFQNFINFVRKYFPKEFIQVISKQEMVDKEIKFYLDQEDLTQREILEYLNEYQLHYNTKIPFYHSINLEIDQLILPKNQYQILQINNSNIRLFQEINELFSPKNQYNLFHYK